MRVAVLTSNEIRHRYVARALADEFDVCLVGYQDTGYRPAETLPQEPSNRTEAILRHHFDERLRQEQRFFGHAAEELPKTPARRIFRFDTQTLNTDATVAALRGGDTDVVVVYGTGLIKPPVLDAYDGRIINLHLGLSPYYRGTATNFYPLLNEEPEYVGVTVHLLTAGIDSGPIIHHGRPDITAEDMPHTVGCKAILVGVERLRQALREFAAGTMTAVPQWTPPRAHLCLRKDYHPEQVVRLYDLIDAGLFPRYAERMHEVAPRVRLVP